MDITSAPTVAVRRKRGGHVKAATAASVASEALTWPSTSACSPVAGSRSCRSAAAVTLKVTTTSRGSDPGDGAGSGADQNWGVAPPSVVTPERSAGPDVRRSKSAAIPLRRLAFSRRLRWPLLL